MKLLIGNVGLIILFVSGAFAQEDSLSLQSCIEIALTKNPNLIKTLNLDESAGEDVLASFHIPVFYQPLTFLPLLVEQKPDSGKCKAMYRLVLMLIVTSFMNAEQYFNLVILPILIALALV